MTESAATHRDQSAPAGSLRRRAAWASLVTVVAGIHIILPLRLGDKVVPIEPEVAVARIQLAPARTSEVADAMPKRQMPVKPSEPAQMDSGKRPEVKDRSGGQPLLLAAAPEEPISQAASAQPMAASSPEGRANRLEYSITGHFKGNAFTGSARMLWTRTDAGYKSTVEITASQGFALLFFQRMESEGRVTLDGLAPERFSEAHRPAADDELRAAFGGTALGHTPPTSDGPAAQDPASLLLQMSQLLTKSSAQVAVADSTPPMPLEVRTQNQRFVFDAREGETVFTPFGNVQTLHFVSRPAEGGEPALLIQAWVSPAYRYLPMRLRLERGADFHMVLSIAQAPQLDP